MTRLVLVLGDQLSSANPALAQADPAGDVVVMAEVRDETCYAPHHPKKIAFILSAMRHFAQELEAAGWQVAYTRLDDAGNSGSIGGELLRRAQEHGASEVLATEPGEWRLITALQELPLDVHILPDTRFTASHKDFEAWAKGRKSLRMEYFYREMRRRTGLLMEGDEPAGGKWNYDAENRKPPPAEEIATGPMQFEPDAITREVLELTAREFPDNFGTLEPFWFGVTRGQARRALAHFIRYALPSFGDYQDAMKEGEDFLYHSVLSPYINAGLLGPMEVCRAAEEAWRAGDVPLNAAEGFIRQIIGWREFMRGIYFLEGPDYPRRNHLGHTRDLPALFWGGKTGMRCLEQAVDQTRREAYAHHIQRLMLTGNFALLAGIDPYQVHEWYLAVYADAYEWAEAPNVIGMSQFADGGIVGSKPYVSSGNYIARMSDHCKNCAYDVRQKTGEGACPFNLLYWHFLDRHRERFAGNPRMSNMYATWDRMDAARRQAVLDGAGEFLARMEEGAPV